MKKSKSTPWEPILRDFEEQLRADGKADNSIATYLRAINQFVESYKDVSSTNAIDQKSVNKWLMQFDSRKGTLNLKKNALRSFLRFLKAERGFKKEIRIVVKDLPRPEPQFLTVQEQERLLQFVKGKGETSPHYVMIKLMIYSGMRISEVIGLRFADVEDDTVTLRQTKHGGVRRKHLKNEIARMLKVYINARRSKYPLNEMPSSSEDFLFMTKYAGKYKPYTRQGVNKVIKSYARSIGITKRISCHTLRHSFSVRFLKRGGSLIGLKNYLGHKDIKTTSIYLHCSADELKADLERL